MEIIYTENYRKLLSNPFPIGVGTTARCYKSRDGKVIKVYKNNYEANYLLKNNQFEDNLVNIGRISNETFIGPEKLLYINDKLAGYIYQFLDANELEHIKKSTRLSSIFANFDIVLENIKKISDQNFLLQDVHGKNILFNGEYRIIDLDRGYFTTIFKTNDIYKKNIKQVFTTVVDQIYGLKPWQYADYIHIDVNRYKYDTDLDMNLINDFCNEFKKVCGNDDPTVKEVRKKTLSMKYTNPYY